MIEVGLGGACLKRCLMCATTFDGDCWSCPACGFAPTKVAGIPSFAPELAEGGEGFEDRYFQELAKLEADNFWFRARNHLILWALKKYFGNAHNLLEIGCGTGFVLSGIAAAFPAMQLTGSEISVNGLGHAARRIPRARFFQMDARTIPYVAEFDVIGAFDVIEHIKQDEVVMTQLFAALKPGGGLLLSVPQHESLWSQTDEHARHVRRYSAADLNAKVTRAGFDVLRLTSFVSLLLPLMFASRYSQRKVREDYDVMAELRLNRAVNFVLEKILDLERCLIRLGVKFPFGGSLLLVARKPLTKC